MAGTSAFPADLVDALRHSQRIVVLTGAGASAESGIPTFRDALTGLWERFDASELATAEAFRRDPELVWGWYLWRLAKIRRAQPNPGHLAIAALADIRPTLTLITQNVDDLHERAGSRRVSHLHGRLDAFRCFDCARPLATPIPETDEPEGGRRQAPPRCAHCGGAIRPGVVWFGESLPVDALDAAFSAVTDCDLLISIGTSGVVMPAAQLVPLARQAGARVLEINPLGSGQAVDWQLAAPSGEALPALLKAAFGI